MYKRQPACTAACPTQATIFGDRDELLAEAHRRIRAHPGKYFGDKVWGEDEVGGTSILYLSDIDLSFMTYGRPLGKKPVPARTVTAMEAVPFAFIGMAGAMAGLNWIIGRRMKNQSKPQEAPKPEDDQDG